MTITAIIIGVVIGINIGFPAGAWWRSRSDAENDAHMSAEIVRLGEAIAEALKPEID